MNQSDMPKTNGKTEVEMKELDVDHELPAADDESGTGQPIRPQVTGEDELAKIRAERDTLIERLARAQADFENARKRASREQQEYRDYALADAVKALLPVLDSFDLALQHPNAEAEEFRSGIDLINKQLHDALAKLGLRLIEAKGKTFNPHLHEAIEMVDTSEAEDHEVLDELQRGYKLKERLLRPAMVRVARNPKS